MDRANQAAKRMADFMGKLTTVIEEQSREEKDAEEE